VLLNNLLYSGSTWSMYGLPSIYSSCDYISELTTWDIWSSNTTFFLVDNVK